jgi:hypothetical protein
MATLRSEIQSRLPEDWRHPLARRSTRSDASAKLLLAGVAVVGLGLLTWHYLGPDLKRYLKIHSM